MYAPAVPNRATAFMEEPEFISKSQRKRDADALQDLGETLIRLSVDQLKRFDLPEELLEAVLMAKRIPVSKGTAFKRQRQYIGKLMRGLDPAPIQEKLDAMKGLSNKENALMHRAEHWRERLLLERDALPALLREFPSAPAAEIERLVAATQAERMKRQPPKHFRELYKLLYAQFKAAETPAATTAANEDTDDE
ncbi:MAG: ribosome biogenesis factor YjgA [Burkholderiales bacterium]|nr:ribosome biogenesis factor YjgA [Burkholderiales bacterium]